MAAPKNTAPFSQEIVSVVMPSGTFPSRAEVNEQVPIIDNAVYVDGKRTANPESLDITFELMRERHGMAWIGLYRPEISEINAVAGEFGLHRLAVEDAIAAHQRPKLER